MSAAVELLISKAFDDYPTAHKLPLGSSWVAAKDENNMIHALGLVGAYSLDKATILNAYAPDLRDCRPFHLAPAGVRALIENIAEGCRSKKTGARAWQVC